MPVQDFHAKATAHTTPTPSQIVTVRLSCESHDVGVLAGERGKSNAPAAPEPRCFQHTHLLSRSNKRVLLDCAFAHHVVQPDAIENTANKEPEHIRGELHAVVASKHRLGGNGVRAVAPFQLFALTRTITMSCIKAGLMSAACSEHVTVPPPSKMMDKAVTEYLYRPIVTRLEIRSAFAYAS